jgi:phenylacetate-CoA ligase
MPMAVRVLGANAIMSHAGRGILDNQIRLGNELNVTVIQHLPSLVLSYFRRAAELGIDIKRSKLRLVAGIGEGWADAYRKKIEADYDVVFHGMYGMSEGAEIAADCGYGGMHTAGESCIVEVIDPETHRVLGPGEEGELVITNLYREAMPVIRYRTDDIGCLLPYQPCPCGRTHPKISMIRGRLSQIIPVKDKKFFPVDIEEVLGGIPDLGYEYQIILERPGEQERLKLKVECLPQVNKLDVLKSRVEDEIGQRLGVESEVELVPQDSIGHAVVKAQRVIAEYQKG